MRYLGIDYGKRKIGLAISEGKIATPLKVSKVSALKDAVAKISAIIDKEQVNQVVVGIPESGEARKITVEFIEQLKKIPPRGWDIIEVEETLSSKEALDQMIVVGKSKKQKGQEDAYSAAIILQNYLDSLNK